MKIMSFNINGIKSAINKGLLLLIKHVNADIICLQEIRTNIKNININIFKNIGYYTYVYLSNKPGYSGISILTKKKCKKIKYGININKFDIEGRLMKINFNKY